MPTGVLLKHTGDLFEGAVEPIGGNGGPLMSFRRMAFGGLLETFGGPLDAIGGL